MRLLSLILIFFLPFVSMAQSKMCIGAIEISGNTKTKYFIILRELPFKVGDSVSSSQIGPSFIKAKQQLLNTQLFVDVNIDTAQIDSTIQVRVHVKERWYLFPVPYFKLVDRNFNQ